MQVPGSVFVGKAESIPGRWYGLSYLMPTQDIVVFHPIPINYVVRWSLDLRDRWDYFRCGMSRRDRETALAVSAARSEGYRRGLADGFFNSRGWTSASPTESEEN